KFIDKKYPEISTLIFSKPILKTVSKSKPTEKTKPEIKKKTKTSRKKKNAGKSDDGQLTMNF
ncbi:MAG TPA: hypothetical protein GXX41_13830, partial [Thermoanaerobacterium sp.]|nr:hypothetical protein [Thermoanaerobacterium sp.]